MKTERNTRAIANAIAESVHSTTPGGWRPRARFPWAPVMLLGACMVPVVVVVLCAVVAAP